MFTLESDILPVRSVARNERIARQLKVERREQRHHVTIVQRVQGRTRQSQKTFRILNLRRVQRCRAEQEAAESGEESQICRSLDRRALHRLTDT